MFSGLQSSASSLDLFGQGKQFNEIFEVFLRLEGLNQKNLLRKKVLEFNFMVLKTPKNQKFNFFIFWPKIWLSSKKLKKNEILIFQGSEVP